ncbi:MAG: hypothetical protein UU98_C0001G0002 [Parcubacteria group bacterium GW2011_GWD2_42_14]|nr:MAG: hypothetical protein UU98_C0001G0002 [Parcubacteria group bacterium GW2011_GWD2_42_14]
MISEVAWMGSADDANAEWIELYNDGESQDVSGWTLVASDGQPSITLEGTIGSHAYALLERTDDDTVAGVTMFMKFTGALSNVGEELQLRNQNGALVDSVDGTDGWSIGGDNVSKDTLQRSGEPSVGAWITAPASPGRGNSGVGTSSRQSHTAPRSKSILYGLPDEEDSKPRLEPALVLDLGEERTVTVGVPTVFLAKTFKERGEEIVVEDIEWNFGDGTTGKGREVTHTYRYEGSYVVTAKGNRKGYLREITDTAHLVVHVGKPSVEIVHVDAGYIELKNTSSEVVEVSGYVLLSGTSHFTIPKNTHILPDTLVRLSYATTKIRGGEVRLFRPDGVLVSVYGTPIVPTPIQKSAVHPSVQKGEPVSLGKKSATILEGLEFLDSAPEFAETASAFTNIEKPHEEDRSASRTWLWILGLIASIATAGFTVVLLRHEQQEVIEGFMIESEKE